MAAAGWTPPGWLTSLQPIASGGPPDAGDERRSATSPSRAVEPPIVPPVRRAYNAKRDAHGARACSGDDRGGPAGERFTRSSGGLRHGAVRHSSHRRLGPSRPQAAPVRRQIAIGMAVEAISTLLGLPFVWHLVLGAGAYLAGALLSRGE